MARLTADTPFLHPECEITESRFGAYVEIGRGTRVAYSTFGDYSYCDRYADIANAEIGKFSKSPRSPASGRPTIRSTLRPATTSSIAPRITGTMRGGMRHSLPAAGPASRISATTPGLAQAQW